MALTLSSFNNTDDTAKGVGFCFIQKPTRGKSVKTVKIRDDPIQIANNNSRIIDTAELRFHTSKLSSSCKVCIRGFVIWGPRRIILSTATCLIFQKGNFNICNFTKTNNWKLSPIYNHLWCASIIGHDVIDIEWKELVSEVVYRQRKTLSGFGLPLYYYCIWLFLFVCWDWRKVFAQN